MAIITNDYIYDKTPIYLLLSPYFRLRFPYPCNPPRLLLISTTQPWVL